MYHGVKWFSNKRHLYVHNTLNNSEQQKRVYLKRYVLCNIVRNQPARDSQLRSETFYYYTLYRDSMYVTCALSLSVYQQ